MAPDSAYTTRALTLETWADFARLVEANNGVWGGCWCMGFHVEGVGQSRSAAQNREAKQAHVREGTVHQVLVYDGGECVGWCQYGPPAELANIKNPKAYAAGLEVAPDWRIDCVFTGSRYRRAGVARVAVTAALAAIREAGGDLVEAYLEQVEGREPQPGGVLPHRAGHPVRGVGLRAGPPDRQVALGDAAAGAALIRRCAGRRRVHGCPRTQMSQSLIRSHILMIRRASGGHEVITIAGGRGDCDICVRNGTGRQRGGDRRVALYGP